MTEIDELEDRVEAAIEDGVYTAEEHAALRESFAALGLREKLALLHHLDEVVETMPGGGDHGAWTALLRVQSHLRQLAAGPAAKGPPPLPLDFTEAKQLLRKYAHDGELDHDERRTLKELLVRLDDRHAQRLYNFAVRREEIAFRPERRAGFTKVRHFIEEHREAGEWKKVRVTGAGE